MNNFRFGRRFVFFCPWIERRPSHLLGTKSGDAKKEREPAALTPRSGGQLELGFRGRTILSLRNPSEG